MIGINLADLIRKPSDVVRDAWCVTGPDSETDHAPRITGTNEPLSLSLDNPSDLNFLAAPSEGWWTEIAEPPWLDDCPF